MKKIIFIFLLLIFGICSAKDSVQPPDKACDASNNPCCYKCDASSAPITINVSPSQTLQTKPDENEKEKPEKSEWEKWTGIGTVAMAVFTFLLALAALWQRFDLKSSSEKQLRAYVAIPPGGLWPSTPPFKTPRFHAHNFGETPSYRTAVRCGMSRDVASITLTNLHQIIEGHILSPDAYVALNFAPETPNIPSKAEDSFCVYGEIDYTDIFGDRWRHHFGWEWADHGEPTHNFMPTAGGNYEEPLGKDHEA